MMPGSEIVSHSSRQPLETGAGKQPNGAASRRLLAGPETPTLHAPLPVGGRDTRIDALRGLALLTIFVDHIPPNVANWYTLHNFSFSDAAEVFVFLAGTSSMLAYGRAFERDGTFAGLRQIGARCAKIYGVQVVLFLLTMAFSWARRKTGYPTPIAGPLLDAGWIGVLRGVVLNALPTYLDILPLYLVLLAVFPLVYALGRVSPWLALTVSGAVWLQVNLCANLNLPNALSADGWYFNPFAWQFLFTLGVLSAALLRPVQVPSPKMRLLQVFCIAYLAFGFLETLNWEHWGLPNLGLLEMEQPGKSLLSRLRVLSILALIYLVFSFPAIRRLCNLRIMRPLAACGRHSLEVFAIGCLLAYASRFLFEFLGASWLLQVGVNAVGIGVTFAVALGLEKRRVRRVTGGTRATGGPKGSRAGSGTIPDLVTESWKHGRTQPAAVRARRRGASGQQRPFDARCGAGLGQPPTDR